MNVRHWLLVATCLALGSHCANVSGQQYPSAVGNLGANPFGWMAGDKFDGCGYGCAPGGDCGACENDWANMLSEDGMLDANGMQGQASCGDALGCLGGCTQSFFACSRWSAGVELTFLKPHFDGNPAFMTLSSNGTTQDSLTETNFNYDAEAAPRVWIELLHSDQLGFQVRYWQLEDSADTAVGSPDENGFGRITHPPFGDVDLSTSIPGSTFAADSELNAYSIDLEATHAFAFGQWAWTASGGLRFAEIEQTYIARLNDENNMLQGTIDYSQQIQGVGPVVGIRFGRPCVGRLSLFGLARGSVLFGDSDSNLVAQEDLDLADSLTTNAVTAGDDLLPIGELQLGLQWLPTTTGCLHPYFHVAMEGQVWGGAGNASSQDGNVGFYGVNFALGFDW